MQNEAAMIRGIGSHYRRGRWQRRVVTVGATAICIVAGVMVAMTIAALLHN
jgi:hypothetical protein